jgi:SAM-dependent methyltransferase
MATNWDTGWAEYYELTEGNPPRALLVRAVELVSLPAHALDLGSGTGNDTRYLLDRGFMVTAVDADTESIRRLKAIVSDRLRVVQCAFDAFPFEPGHYALINAQHALPFNSPDTFTCMFGRLRGALAPGGVFTGDLFGERDAWNVPGSRLSFHTREEVAALLDGLEVIELTEVETQARLIGGGLHHAHGFDIIARRPIGDEG